MWTYENKLNKYKFLEILDATKKNASSYCCDVLDLQVGDSQSIHKAIQ